MQKLVIDELDVKLNKEDIIKLCKDNNISWLEYMNVDGGRYIECIIGYNYNLEQSEFLDIYYDCKANKKLYGFTFTRSKKFYIDLIMKYFLRKDKSE